MSFDYYSSDREDMKFKAVEQAKLSKSWMSNSGMSVTSQ